MEPSETHITELLNQSDLNTGLSKISRKVIEGVRITVSEALTLYREADLALLAMLSRLVNRRHNGNKAYFNRNFHIEPTNICVFNCRFCSYHQHANSPKSWTLTPEEIRKQCQAYAGSNVTEVHIVGGVHPLWDIDYYGKLIETVKEVLPDIHIKAYSAVELNYVIKKAGLTYREGIRKLKSYGLDSIPGGGAEIFDAEIRKQICPDKASAEEWIALHRAAHQEGVTSNATMLYGHIESYRHRAEHMEAIRNLQDETGGFNCFIPLKFRAANNPMGHLGEVSLTEDLKNYAVARIFLDNFKHLKAYWPMLGIENTQLALHFGADDIDGTIDDTTKIYTMAGMPQQETGMTVERLTGLIRNAGLTPVERNSLYQPIREY